MHANELKEALTDFKKRVPKSRDLANEINAFIDELLEEIDDHRMKFDGEIPDTRLAIVNIIDRILTQEPDATLRKKLEDLIERVKMANGDIDPDTILLALI